MKIKQFNKICHGKLYGSLVLCCKMRLRIDGTGMILLRRKPIKDIENYMA